MSLPDKITVQVMFGAKGRINVVDKGDSLKSIKESERNQILELLSHAPDKVFIIASDRKHYVRVEKSEGVCIGRGSGITYKYVAISERDYGKL